MTLKKIIAKSTLISILASILLLISIPSIIYDLTRDSSKAGLFGILILIIDFVIFIVLLIDRVIVKKIPPIRLSIYEFVFLILCTTIYLYSQRKIIVDIENENVEYLLVIENPGNLTNDETRREFPFNKRISSRDGVVVVDLEIKNIEFNTNADYISYYYKTYEFEKYPKVILFCWHRKAIDISQNLIDSLMNKE